MADLFIYSLVIFCIPSLPEKLQALYKWAILFLSSQQMAGLVQDIGNCPRLRNEFHKGKEHGKFVFFFL